ncbi:MAG TPA: LPS export ABC transporter permease LptF [Beijerinckiaceae bacterium]|nr:LPS export ABC transporter permease LptF [Beijerinckiaceae bacterium]
MQILERYIFRTAVSAFLLCLCALTGVIWISSALKELDLITGKGQSVLLFLYITLLSIPALIMIIAPLALFISIVYTLNKFNGDSELIVMSAAGVPPMKILRPFLTLTLATAMLVGLITIKVMPESFRSLRDLVVKMRADLITQFVQEGKFVTLDAGITFHYKEKGPNGILLGIMFQDRRNANMVTTYLAERGRMVEVDGLQYFLLEKGSLQRQDKARKESALVYFERYAFDMDQFGGENEKIVYKPRERTTWELMTLDKEEFYVKWQIGRFRAELHERFVQPLYAFAMLAIAFAALGSARTTRQGRGAAMAAAGIAVLLLRIAGFWASSLGARGSFGIAMMYVVPIAAVGMAATYSWWTQDRPQVLVRAVDGLTAVSNRLGLTRQLRAINPGAIVTQMAQLSMKLRRS